MKILKKLSNEKGFAIIIALALLALFTTVLIMAADRSLVDIEMSYNQLHEEQAFYVADAGVKIGLKKLNVDYTWRDGFTHYPLGDQHFALTVIDSTTDPDLADTIVLTCSCQLELAKSVVEIMAVPEKDNPFLYAMYGDNSIDIRNAIQTDSYDSDSGAYSESVEVLGGDIASNGTIDVSNGAVVGGDVTTSLEGGTDIDIGVTVEGEVVDDVAEYEMPDIPQSEYDWAESVNCASSGITGSYYYDETTGSLTADGAFELTGGVYFFSSMTLYNTANLSVAPGAEVIIYVTGNVTLQNSSSINEGGVPADCMIYSQGDFVLTNSGDIYAVFYSPDGTADLRNSGEFYGAIGAEDIVADNSINFHYDRSLSKVKKGLTGVVDMVAWREVL